MRKHVTTQPDNMHRDFTIKQFQKLYQECWVNKGRRAQQLVDRIKEIDPTAKLDYKVISKWATGEYPPGLRYLTIIIEIFKEDIPTLDLSYFSYDLNTHADKYRYSKDYVNDVEEHIKTTATNNFKIDLSLLQGIRNIVPDFDDKFPVYTPLYFNDGDAEGKPYRRKESAETLAPDAKHGLFRITRDGKTVFLTVYDLKLIRNLQLHLRQTVYRWFDKVAAELVSAETEINLDYIERNPPGEDFFTDIPDATLDDYLQRFDRWGIYSEEEHRKYKLPYHPWVDKSTIIVTKDEDGNEVTTYNGGAADGEY